MAREAVDKQRRINGEKKEVYGDKQRENTVALINRSITGSLISSEITEYERIEKQKENSRRNPLALTMLLRPPLYNSLKSAMKNEEPINSPHHLKSNL